MEKREITTQSEFESLRKGHQVSGCYMGVEYTGTVRSVCRNTYTKNLEVEIDFPEPRVFRGDWDVRTGLIITHVRDDERLEVLS